MKRLEQSLHDTDRMLCYTLEEGFPDRQFVRKIGLSLKRCALVHYL